MSIRLTESKLRQIIREEAAKLSRRPRASSRRLRESFYQNLDLPATIGEVIALTNPSFVDLTAIRGYIATGDVEGAMDILLQILGAAEDDRMAGEQATLASDAIQSMSDDEILDVLSQVEEFREDTPEAQAQSDTFHSLGHKGAPDTMTAAKAMAPVIMSSIPKRSIDYARKTGKADSLFMKVMRHPQFRSLAVKHGSSPSNHLAHAIIGILVGR